MKIATCWDDGVHDDVRLADLFRTYGARASFNLNAASHRAERYVGWTRDGKDIYKLALPELREVYDGFLIANHTLSHPHLDRIAPDEARRNIEEGRDALEQIFGRAIRGFAYPFGSYNDAVKELVRESGHLYARTTGKVESIFPVEDPMAFHPNCHFLTEDFWRRFDAVHEADGVFYFWGHSYELVTEEDWRTMEDKISRLSAAGEWVDLPDLFTDGSVAG